MQQKIIKLQKPLLSTGQERLYFLLLILLICMVMTIAIVITADIIKVKL